jgi:hypothetical protein
VEGQAKRASVIAEDTVLPGYNQTPTDAEAGAEERRTSVLIGDTEYPPPTAEERASLRRVAGTVPWIAWMLCIVEFAERASYYGASQIFSNFMQFPLPKGKIMDNFE